MRTETLKIHKIAPGIRVASALSCVEILVALYYGKILRFNPHNPSDEDRDRFIISKAHGSVSFYPILADLGYFPFDQLGKVGKVGSILGDIPDNSIPGYETINGSLGHGLGVACGIALGLKAKQSSRSVFVLLGDGELFEGSVWESIMFASQHNLDNLVLIIDNNRICMLDYCTKIINIEPIEEKFAAFGWKHFTADGHDIEELHSVLSAAKEQACSSPKVVIANTVKGKGVPKLEGDSLCHIRALKPEEIDALLREMQS
ncbi:MAG: transketolase [Desulfuromonadaceae bacterium]|nr:transketolase [Desulfuromonadaceae bacterium]MDD5104200.1 transketolase [Desulfuromonadaceae bacterium]